MKREKGVLVDFHRLKPRLQSSKCRVSHELTPRLGRTRERIQCRAQVIALRHLKIGPEVLDSNLGLRYNGMVDEIDTMKPVFENLS
jgi:hypothetical protein